MIQDFLLSVFSFLVIDSFVAEMNQTLRIAGAPQAVAQQVLSCGKSAAPVLAERAWNDWWWAGTTTISVSIGMVTPEQVLLQAAPQCRPAIEAAQPFLTGLRS
jgi:hypothetical protein